MNKNWLKVLVAVSAITIAGSAAFFSVTGLGVLFSGAALSVMIMAGSLEFAKLVTATYLKQEWDTIKGVNKWYLTSAVVILMVITSAGIFGYLSNAFQQQNLKLDQVSREIQVWQNKIDYSNQQILTLQGQQKDLSSTQNTLLSKGNVNSRLIRSADNRDKQSTKISNKINSLQDSIVVYNGKINDIKNNNINIEREVGGFRFVAESFGVPLNTVVKFFIILIVIVFDPLAVALVISFNQLVLATKRKDEEEVINEEEPTKIDSKDLVGEISRLRLSEEDLKKLEEVLLNPPAPSENLKEAVEKYNDVVKGASLKEDWALNNDEIVERIEERKDEELSTTYKENIDLKLDEVNNELDDEEPFEYDEDDENYDFEDEIVDETLNETPISKEEEVAESVLPDDMKKQLDDIREYLSKKSQEEILTEMMKQNQELGLYDEPFDNPLIKEKPADWEPTISDNFTIGPDGAYEREEEEFSTIEPSEEEEDENFSTIEPNSENIFQDNFTESEIVEEISQNVKQDEPEISEEDILENLNNFETETFSEVPTTLEIPEFKEDTSPFVQLPEPDETSIPNEEDEKKNF